MLEGDPIDLIGATELISSFMRKYVTGYTLEDNEENSFKCIITENENEIQTQRIICNWFWLFLLLDFTSKETKERLIRYFEIEAMSVGADTIEEFDLSVSQRIIHRAKKRKEQWDYV